MAEHLILVQRIRVRIVVGQQRTREDCQFESDHDDQQIVAQTAEHHVCLLLGN